MNDGMTIGYLIVRVSTASGAIPIEGASVIIQGKEDNNRDVLFSFVTNRDGLTPKITLPSVSVDLSTSPSPSQTPYTNYTIDVFKEGYYPQHYINVPIFEGVTAVQSADIIPISEYDGTTPYSTDGQSFNEYENPYL